MNNHFEDALYHLKRASEHAALGTKETLEPVEARLRELTGREKQPEPERGRVGTALENAKRVEAKAETDVRNAIGATRRRVSVSRSRQ